MAAVRRVVFDCNILIQGMASPLAAAGQCVQLALDGKVQLFLTPAIFDELRDVASRPRVVAKLRLVPERVLAFLEAIEIAAEIWVDVPETFTYARDPDDAHYINLALATDARLIVSRDRDLLDLMDAAKPEAAEFLRRFPQLQIMDPAAFLHEVRADPGEATGSGK